MTLTAPEYVEAPAVDPMPFGLLSVTSPVDRPGGHWLMGAHYEPDACNAVGDLDGLCLDPVGFGTLAAAGDALDVELTVTGTVPTGSYHIDWGDSSDDDETTPDGATHTYAGADTYVITITGPDGYHAVISLDVDDTDPSEADAVISRAPVSVNGVPLVEAFPTILYADLTCTAPSRSPEVEAERARRALRLREAYALERVMARHLALADDSVDITPTPGTPVHVVDALGLLERYAGSHYGGRPILHADRRMTTVLGAQGAVKRDGTRLETTLGSYVAAGAGYDALRSPDDADPSAGNAWMYVTGAVLVHRQADIDVFGPFMSRFSGATDEATNDTTVRAQRGFILGWECITAAVLTKTAYTEPAA